MQSIILAAGMGVRLGHLTNDNTKCMIQVNGQRLIDRLLNQLTDFFLLNRIIIVTGYCRENLENHIGNSWNNTPIIYIRNEIYDVTNNIYSLFLTKELLKEDDTILLESDLILEENVWKKLYTNHHPNVSLVSKYENGMSGTMVMVDERDYISRFISPSNFSFHEVEKYYKTVNIHKFSQSFLVEQFVPLLDAYIKSFPHNAFYEQILSLLSVLGNTKLKSIKLNNEKWYEIDDIKDLTVAETLFCDDNEMLIRYQQQYGGYWRFPKITDFSLLVNPFFPPDLLMENLKLNFSNLITQYPSGEKNISRLAASLYGVREEYIVVGNGAAELIRLLMNISQDKIGIICPTFEEYINCTHTERIVPFVSTNTDFQYSINEITDYFADKNISLLVIINPDNPSGQLISRRELQKIIQWGSLRQIQVILDDSFIDFSDHPQDNRWLTNDLLEQNPNLILIKSLSKSYGVPGLRLGIAASGNTGLVAKIKKELPIWNINSLGEYFLQILPQYRQEYKKAHSNFVQERKRMYNKLKEISYVRPIPSQTNFFLCEVTSLFSSFSLSINLLKEYNILIKDCSTKKGFNNRSYVRIAIKSKKENNKLLKALKKYEKTK